MVILLSGWVCPTKFLYTTHWFGFCFTCSTNSWTRPRVCFLVTNVGFSTNSSWLNVSVIIVISPVFLGLFIV